MPQVYWMGAHNPAEQLVRCVREFEAVEPARPIIPTGAAFVEAGWEPTSEEVLELLDTAKSLDMEAVNFWEWMNCRKKLPHIWELIRDYDWDGINDEEVFFQNYLGMLNANDPDKLVELYADNAFHITGDSTVIGRAGIKNWYRSLFQKMPNAVFTKKESSGEDRFRRLRWTASSDRGFIRDGSDAFYLNKGKIKFHFSYFSISN